MFLVVQKPLIKKMLANALYHTARASQRAGEGIDSAAHVPDPRVTSFPNVSISPLRMAVSWPTGIFLSLI